MGTKGKARMSRLGEVIRLISKIEDECVKESISLAWVKAHVSIGGNEEADVEAKEAARIGGGKAVTQVSIRAWVKEVRTEERIVHRFGWRE